LLRLGLLTLDDKPVAMVFCMDYQSSVYLYNNAYDPRYRELSVGFLSKALSIKDAIAKTRKRYDLLKGGEKYKYHLGGKPLSIHSCSVRIGSGKTGVE
jgi:CelD/BcsL family acetyltransferase involved in cellulose biosynthesis